ncbi:HK97 family phage prohead protease [Paracoccaceae bacterium GXU_MW_L88]
MIFEGSPMPGLEVKFQRLEPGALGEGAEIAGYASVFGIADQGGDRVMPGAFAAGLGRLKAEGRSVKMLWQHDPARPIGVWDEMVEDAHGLRVKGRLLTEVQAGREAKALLEAGAIDGLSIGYRTLRAGKAAGGRELQELDLWEVSLVTFPMLPEARVGGRSHALARGLAEVFTDATSKLGARPA